MAMQRVVLCLLLEALFAWSNARQLLGLPGDSLLVDGSYGTSGQPVLLQAMMNTSVSTLVFKQSEFVLVPEAWKFITQRTPYMLNRPFLVTSQAPAAPTLIDFHLLSHRVVLEQHVTFTFSSVNLANVRTTEQIGVEWFMLSEGATVALSNVVVIDLVCYQAPVMALAAAQLSPNVLGFPPNNISIVNSTCVRIEGSRRCFSDNLHYSRFAVVTTYRNTETGSEQPGYTLIYDNVTHVCRSYLDQQCVQQHGASFCWDQQARQLAPELFGLDDSGLHALGGGVIAALAVSCCAFLTAAVASSILLYRRRSSRGQPVPPQKMTDDASARCSVQFPTDLLPEPRLTGRSSTDSAVSGSHYSGCPLGVSLGVLLGAGSFGRVYKARWHSTDVAVKVMTCWPGELTTKVLTEAELMMSMQHENVVRALNCSVVRRKPTAVLEAVVDPTSSTAVNSPPVVTVVHAIDSANSFKKLMCCFGSGTTVSCLSFVWPASSNSMAPAQAASKAHDHNSNNNKQEGLHVEQQQTGMTSEAEAMHAMAGVCQGDISLTHSADLHKDAQQQRSISRTGSSFTPLTHDSTGKRRTVRQEPDASPYGDPVEVWLVMELCSGGSLKEACSVPRDKLDMARLVSRLLEVAMGMAYLHTKGVLHSDLKAANVLLKNTVHGSYGQVAKISDFGLSSRLLADATHHSTQTTGTITHTAPEVLHTGRISAAADVYSFGIMMWELFTGKSAFSGSPYGSVALSVVNGARPPLPAGIPEEYKLLMCSCWAQDPLQRPDFDQVGRCLLLMLDGLETMEGPLLDAGYLAAVEESPVDHRAGDRVDHWSAGQQEVQQQQMACDTGGSPVQKQLHLQQEDTHGQPNAGGVTRVTGSKKHDNMVTVAPGRSSSEHRLHLQTSVQQSAVEVRQQQQQRQGQRAVNSSAAPGLNSRHVHDL